MRPLRLLIGALAVVALALPQGVAAADPKQDVIVVFQDSVTHPQGRAAALARKYGTTPTQTYEYAIKGFAARVPASAVRALRADPEVQLVSLDSAVHVADTTQAPATWGIDRIDQHALPLSDSYTYQVTGAGVEAYVIDTGILFSHADFGGRAVQGADYVGDGRNGVDCQGHGTHVAGTIGGQTYGVAKGVKLIAVRVFDCAGNTTWAKVIKGVDYVTGQKQVRPSVPMVANMSIDGGPDAATDLAVTNSIAAGVSYAVAAGNGLIFGGDACNSTPARVANAMTVGATDSSDARAFYSNYGSCVDWFAPGTGITSDGIASNTATAVKDGTSMASPHTAGVAALYLELHPGDTPAQVRDALFQATTKDKVTNANSINDHLLYSLFATGPANQPPTAGDLSISTNEDAATGWTPSVSDPDAGATLTCTIVTPPTRGTATVAANCSSGTYTPNANANGTDSLVYRVSDGTATDTGTVSISISAVNDPPSAGADSYSTTVGTALVRAAPGVLSNDGDVDQDPLAAVLDTGPSHGTVTLNTNGGFTYTPAAGYIGADSFTYRASDGVATSGLATVDITVTPASATTMHVADLDATATTKGNKWTAAVTIEVRDDLGTAVSGVVVTGDFTSTGGTNRTCTTATTGRCTITSAQIAKSVPSVTFTVRAVSKTGLAYLSSANGDPEGDSNGTSIIRTRT